MEGCPFSEAGQIPSFIVGSEGSVETAEGQSGPIQLRYLVRLGIVASPVLSDVYSWRVLAEHRTKYKEIRRGISIALISTPFAPRAYRSGLVTSKMSLLASEAAGPPPRGSMFSRLVLVCMHAGSVPCLPDTEFGWCLCL